MKDIINIKQGKADIKELNEKFSKYAKQWEYECFSDEEKSFVALKELHLVLNKMDNYKGFIFEYNESEYKNPKYNKWYQNQNFSETELYECDVDKNNYGIADAVACDIKDELVLYIQAEINRRISDIGLLCEIERYQTLCEFFDEEFAKQETELDTSIIDDIEEKKERIIEKILK